MNVVCIDIGNTNITVGVFRDGNLEFDFRLSSSFTRTEDEYAMEVMRMFEFAKVEKPDGFCVSSVVPTIQDTFEKMFRKYFPESPVVVLGPGVKTGIAIKYDSPKDVGADRVANAVGAWELYSKGKGKPTVVVDFGTAVTFDCITEKGEYIGGSIFPGIKLAIESLFLKTAKLPNIKLEEPRHVIGRNTTESIQAGVVFGYASLVEGMVDKIERELGKDPILILTGGNAKFISKFISKNFIVDEYLTLKGLFVVWKMNVKRRR